LKEKNGYSILGGSRGLNLEPYIYYALSLPTELNSRGQKNCYSIEYDCNDYLLCYSFQNIK